jgi:hypothetical protein
VHGQLNECPKGHRLLHSRDSALPNNSLMLTRLAGENAKEPGLPSSATINGEMPEPPGSIARGR